MAQLKSTINPPSDSLVLSHYQNGITIQIPIWYLHRNGHELEDKIKNTFPSLKKFQKSTLKMEIVNRVIDDLPEFIPTDIVDLFQSIQNS